MLLDFITNFSNIRQCKFVPKYNNIFQNIDYVFTQSFPCTSAGIVSRKI